MDSVGTRIKSTRLSIGLSQMELADAADVSQPTVANWENDSHAPRHQALGRLAKILETSPQWLMSGGEHSNGHTLAPRQYLKTSIQHVPIINWPNVNIIKETCFDNIAAHDYIAISTQAQIPFALIASDPAMAAHFPIGVAIIFDAQPCQLEEGNCYLFIHEDEVILRRWQSTPNRLEALPNQSAAPAEFLTEEPVPIARALLSVRRH